MVFLTELSIHISHSPLEDTKQLIAASGQILSHFNLVGYGGIYTENLKNTKPVRRDMAEQKARFTSQRKQRSGELTWSTEDDWNQGEGRKLAIAGGELVFKRPVPLNDKLDSKLPLPAGDNNKFYSLSMETGEVEWEFTAPDGATTSPALFNNKLYFGAADGVLYVVHIETGELEWSLALDSKITGGPVIIDGIVYVGTTGGNLHAVDVDTQEIAWTVSVNGQITSRPTVVGDRVYFGTVEGSGYHAFNINTQEQVWQQSPSNYSTGQQEAVAVVDGRVHACTQDGYVHTMDADTGEVLWQAGDFGGSLGVTPAVYNGALYFAARDDNAYAYDAATGEQKWKAQTSQALGSPVIHDGVLYTGSEPLRGFDIETGDVVWEVQSGGFAMDYSIIDGTIYVGSIFGNMEAFDIASETQMWSKSVKDVSVFWGESIIGTSQGWAKCNMPGRIGNTEPINRL